MWPIFIFPVWLQDSSVQCRCSETSSDRVGRTFNRSGAFQTVAPDRFKAFNKVYDAGLQHNLKSYRISGFMFGLILSFLSNIQL